MDSLLYLIDYFAMLGLVPVYWSVVCPGLGSQSRQGIVYTNGCDHQLNYPDYSITVLSIHVHLACTCTVSSITVY